MQRRIISNTFQWKSARTNMDITSIFQLKNMIIMINQALLHTKMIVIKPTLINYYMMVITHQNSNIIILMNPNLTNLLNLSKVTQWDAQLYRMVSGDCRQ